MRNFESLDLGAERFLKILELIKEPVATLLSAFVVSPGDISFFLTIKRLRSLRFIMFFQ
ncbi:hypothetical protein D3C72_2536190 [compost metagenome]